jgi:hypothetical protein
MFSVGEYRYVCAAGHDIHLRDEIDVGERAPAQADEAGGIEPRLEILEPMADACRSLFIVDTCSSSPSAMIDAICDTGRMMISSCRRTGIRSR